MRTWKPARILYLILAIMLTFSVIPFIPFSINTTLAMEPNLGMFGILFFLYDAIGLLIAITILTRVKRDHYNPTGAMLGFMTYALAIVGHFLFYRYGQELLTSSQFFQSESAEQLFRFVIILAVITWVFNALALVMSYIEVFDLRNAAREPKVHKKPAAEHIQSTHHTKQARTQQPVDAADFKDTYKNINPEDHIVKETFGKDAAHDKAAQDLNHEGASEHAADRKNIRVTPEQLRQGGIAKHAGDAELINIIIEGVNLSQIAISEDGIAIDADAGDVKAKAAHKKTSKTTKKASTSKKAAADNEVRGVSGSYIAQLTSDMLDGISGEAAAGKKTRKRKSHSKVKMKDDETEPKKNKKVKIITADMLDDDE